MSFTMAILNTISYSQTTFLIQNKVIEVSSKFFDKVAEYLLPCIILLDLFPFLRKGVTSANYKEEVKLADKNSAIISIFSLILVRIMFFCKALAFSKFIFRCAQCSICRHEIIFSCYIFELQEC